MICKSFIDEKSINIFLDVLFLLNLKVLLRMTKIFERNTLKMYKKKYFKFLLLRIQNDERKNFVLTSAEQCNLLQIYTSYSSGSDSIRNYYGPSPSTAPSTQLSTAPLPPQPIQTASSQPPPCNLYSTPMVPTPASNLLTTNTSSYVGLNNISPLPTRRYSYSGTLPPSISISDNLNLIHNQDSNITNLITETCQSISRSSNILNRQLSADMALSCTSLSNLIEENIESDIVKYDLINEITTTASATPLNFVQNFYSQPRKLPYVPPTYRNQPHLISDDYLLSKPIFSKNLNALTSSYINDGYHYAEPHSYTQTPHFQTSHYASNPCLSSQYPNQNHLSFTHHPLSSFNRNYYQSPHQQPFSSRPPSISSLNRYTALSNNYSSSFNAQPYYRTSSRLDLDNPNKGGEIKRQVSFKFDVDQMSFDP